MIIIVVLVIRMRIVIIRTIIIVRLLQSAVRAPEEGVDVVFHPLEAFRCTDPQRGHQVERKGDREEDHL